MIKNIFKSMHKIYLSVFGRDAKILTTFNGVGTFSYALKLIGLKIDEQIYCEIDEVANKTYRKNNKFKLSSFVNDINKLLVKVKRGERFDFLVQTPPCVSFSSQGKRQGLKSLSGNLFLKAIELQKKVDSTVVVYENVLGLVHHEKYIYTYRNEFGEEFETRTKKSDKELKNEKLTLINRVEDSYSSLINPEYDGKKKSIGLTLRVIEEQLLEDDRYNYYWKVIDSSTQGVPEARKRIFIIGIKKEFDKSFKFPDNIDLKYTVEDVLEPEINESHFFKNSNNYELNISNQKKRRNKIHTYGRYVGIKYESDGRVSFPYVAPTITTNNNNLFLTKDGIRTLTQLENQRVHGFNDDFVFVGNKTEIDRQLGNLVCPPVYARLVISILNSLRPVIDPNIKVIKRKLKTKCSLNYLYLKEEVAVEYLDFINNGGIIIIQVEKYETLEDKRTETNPDIYFIKVQDLEQMNLINRSYRTFRFRVVGKISKYIFPYEEIIQPTSINSEQDFKDYETQTFNNMSTLGSNSKNIISCIRHKKKLTKKHLEQVKKVNSIDLKVKVKKRANNKVFRSNKLINTKQTTLFSYCGSKMKFTPQIQKTIRLINPQKVKYCIDALMGSGNFSINNFEKIDAEYYIMNDRKLIIAQTFKAVKEDYKKVQEHYLEVRNKFYKTIPEKYHFNRISKEYQPYCQNAREYYMNVINELNKETDIFKIAGSFIWMMQYTTGGHLKELKDGSLSNSNYSWSFKVKDKLKHIEHYSKILNEKKVIIENMDVFELIKKYSDENSFIYLDPPYLNTELVYNSSNSYEFQTKLLKSTNHFKYRLYSNENCKDLYDLGINKNFDYETSFPRSTKIGTSNKCGSEYLAFSINNGKKVRLVS